MMVMTSVFESLLVLSLCFFLSLLSRGSFLVLLLKNLQKMSSRQKISVILTLDNVAICILGLTMQI